jgi:CrcB protein
MTAGMTVAIALAGGLGASARYLVDWYAVRWFGPDRPTGTLAVNVSGALLLGLLVAVAMGERSGWLGPPWLPAAVGTGFLGAYTTFSTWMIETLRLAEAGRRTTAAVNIIASVAAGWVAAWAGLTVGAAI